MVRISTEAKHGPKSTSRSERMTARQNLKLMARGNPWREELEEIEEDSIVEDFEYWVIERERQGAEMKREMEEHYFDSLDLDNDDWYDAHGYDRIDEDDSLML